MYFVYYEIKIPRIETNILLKYFLVTTNQQNYEQAKKIIQTNNRINKKKINQNQSK